MEPLLPRPSERDHEDTGAMDFLGAVLGMILAATVVLTGLALAWAWG